MQLIDTLTDSERGRSWTWITDFSRYVVSGNWSPALQAALDRIKTRKGGVLYLPAGPEYKLTSAVSYSVTNTQKWNLSIVGERGAAVGIQTGVGVDAIRIDEPRRLVVDGLIFYGLNGSGIADCASALRVTGPETYARVRNCSFLGVLAHRQSGADPLGSVIRSESGIVVEDCDFGGCSANGSHLVWLEYLTWQTSIERCTFVDYGNYGPLPGHPATLYAKTSTASASWIGASNYNETGEHPLAFTGNGAPGPLLLRVKDCGFDEGATDQVFVYGGSTGRVPLVLVEGCQGLLSSSASANGVRVVNAGHVEVRLSTWKGQGNTRPAVRLEGVETAVIDRVHLDQRGGLTVPLSATNTCGTVEIVEPRAWDAATTFGTAVRGTVSVSSTAAHTFTTIDGTRSGS